MNDPIIPIEKIKQHARDTADCGQDVNACPHEHCPDIAAIWKEAFEAQKKAYAQEITS